MRVNGQEVDQAVIDACLARMKSGIYFRAWQIEQVVAEAGIPTATGDAMRVSDRVIQRERKAGNIEQVTTPQRCWKWIGATA